MYAKEWASNRLILIMPCPYYTTQQVRQAHARQGRGTLTVTPEYGPAPYSVDVSGVIEDGNWRKSIDSFIH